MLGRFLSNSQGNIALLFAVLAVPIIGAGGVAIDYLRASAERTKAQEAIDAAVLAGVRALAANPEDEAGAKNKALKAYRANYRPDAQATFSVAAGEMTGVVEGGIPTTLSKVLGFNSLRLNVVSSASAGSRGMELALVLDVSGSMSGEIPSLRTAATSLLDEVYGARDTLPNVWVALAPFSGRVNVINYGSGWLTAPPTTANGPTGPVANSCKYNSVNASYPRLCPDRRAPDGDQDDTPPSQQAFTEYTSNWQVCPVPRAIGLSARRSEIQPAINTLCAGHGTSTHEGIAWGWRMVSPRWRGLWGAADLPKSYAESPGKYVVIMTDGVNHPNQSGDSLTTAQADAKLLQTCAKMKAEGITIYAVTFKMNGALASLYQQCATKPEFQFDAESAVELDEAFSEIGRSVASGELRLTR